MDYPSLCQNCGGEIASWNKSGYCSRTAECRRKYIAAWREDAERIPFQARPACRKCGKPTKAKTGYCCRTPECASFHYAARGAMYRLACFEAYGGARCYCCGEDRIYFLSLDHVNGDGAEERKRLGMGTNIYGHLYHRGFPEPDRYQILCYNCNFAKGTGPCCPCSLELTDEDLEHPDENVA